MKMEDACGTAWKWLITPLEHCSTCYIQVGTDTDALAVKASQRNAALNDAAVTMLQCQPRMDDADPLAAHGLPAHGHYDVVMANILQGPLLDLGPRLTAYLRPGGLLVLSGILQTQVIVSCELHVG